MSVDKLVTDILGEQPTVKDPALRDMINARMKAGGEVKMGKGGAIKSLVKAIGKELPEAKASQKTQIPGTEPTYRKAYDILEREKPGGRTLDYGAGLGHGSRLMGAESFEPFPREGFKPDFIRPEDIPTEEFDRLVNLNVLNVMPREMRDATVENIGRVMRPGGMGIVTTRGRDVLNAAGEAGPEPMSKITSIGTYQKGFSPEELREYLKYMLGEGYDISRLNLGPAGAVVRKKEKGRAEGGAVQAAPYGLRETSGMPKGKGYFGELPAADGVMTELSASDDAGDFPLIVPTLTREELEHLQSGGQPTEEIYAKAKAWAESRKGQGRDPFATSEDLRMPVPEYAKGGDVHAKDGGPPGKNVGRGMAGLRRSREPLDPKEIQAMMLDVPAGVGVPFAEAGAEYLRGNVEDAKTSAAIDAALTAVPVAGALAKPAYRTVKGAVQKAAPAVREAARGALESGVESGAILDPRMQAIAYHGSPHKFEKFDPSKIGTGEGAQSYGHGLYFAESPKVAKGYQETLSKNLDPIVGGEPFDRMNPRHQAAAALHYNFNNPEATLITLNGMAKNASKEMKSIFLQAKKLIDVGDIRATLPKVLDQSGFLYKVDIPDESVARMLDWDKPLEQQPTIRGLLKSTDYEVGLSVKEAEKIADERLRQEAYDWADETGGDPVDYMNNANWEKYVDDVMQESGKVHGSTTGEELHKIIMRDQGYRKELFDPYNYQVDTSETLRGLGIPGIKYLDATSRSAGEGTRNFVVFPGEEESVKILERKKKGGAVQKYGKGGVVKSLIKKASEALEKPAKRMSKAEAIERGLYHEIGGGLKLQKPVTEVQVKVEPDPKVTMSPRRVLSPESMQGGVAFPLVGDRAATGKVLKELEGAPMDVRLEGGPEFMIANPGAGWASGKGVLTGLSKRVQEGAESGRDVYGVYTAMGPQAVDFNTMVTEALLNQLDVGALRKADIKAFDQAVRSVKGQGGKPKAPDFPGVAHPELKSILMEGPGGQRDAFVKAMAKAQFQNKGFPDVVAARVGVTDPALIDVSRGSTGFTVAKMDPAGTVFEQSGHTTYPFDLAGEYVGGFEQQIPHDIMFYDPVQAKRLLGSTPIGAQKSLEINAPLQYLDQEWLDRVMNYLETQRKLREGFKKGGKVKTKRSALSSLEKAK